MKDGAYKEEQERYTENDESDREYAKTFSEDNISVYYRDTCHYPQERCHKCGYSKIIKIVRRDCFGSKDDPVWQAVSTPFCPDCEDEPETRGEHFKPPEHGVTLLSPLELKDVMKTATAIVSDCVEEYLEEITRNVSGGFSAIVEKKTSDRIEEFIKHPTSNLLYEGDE